MKKKTHYHFILDQSGSMQDCIHPTITGFNEQLQLVCSLQERHPDQELLFGLTRFNNEVMHTFFAAHPATISELTEVVYRPNGTTALYDAIGLTVKLLQHNLRKELTHDSSTVVIVILTDGYENSSKEFTLSDIQSIIKELEATNKWTFSYLGATRDAVAIARNLNIKTQNSMAFNKEQMPHTYDRLRSSISSYMSKRGKGEDLSQFLEEEK